MNQEEIYNIYNRIQQILLSVIGCALEYKGWSDEFVRTEIKDHYDKVIKQIQNEYHELKIQNLNEQQLKSLGFGKWTENSKLLLIPIWLFPILKKVEPNLEIVSIDGKKCKISERVDNDTRFGMIAYGLAEYAE